MGIASAPQVAPPAIRLREIEAELAALRREQRLFRRLGFGENIKVMHIVALQLERQECLDAVRPQRRSHGWDIRAIGESAHLDPVLRSWPGDVARRSFASTVTGLWVGGTVLGSFLERCVGVWRDGAGGESRLGRGKAALRHAMTYAMLGFGLLLFIARTVLALEGAPRPAGQRVLRRGDVPSHRTANATSARGRATGEASRAMSASARAMGGTRRAIGASGRAIGATGKAVVAASSALRTTAGVLRVLGGLALAVLIAFVRWAYPRILSLRVAVSRPRRPARPMRRAAAPTRAATVLPVRGAHRGREASRRPGVLALEVRRVPISKVG